MKRAALFAILLCSEWTSAPAHAEDRLIGLWCQTDLDVEESPCVTISKAEISSNVVADVLYAKYAISKISPSAPNRWTLSAVCPAPTRNLNVQLELRDEAQLAIKIENGTEQLYKRTP
jgi:hypothetical protein